MMTRAEALRELRLTEAQLRLSDDADALVRRAYRRAALREHPDRHPKAPGRAAERFQRVHRAYQLVAREAAAPGASAWASAWGGSDEDGDSEEVAAPAARPGIVPSLGAGLAAMERLPRADYHDEFMALEGQQQQQQYGGELDDVVRQVDDMLYSQDPSRVAAAREALPPRPDCEPRVLDEIADEVEG